MIHLNRFRLKDNMYIINLLSLLFFFIQFMLTDHLVEAAKFEYHNEGELEQFLKNFTQTTKNIHTQMYSIGNSALRNTPFWVMKLSKNESRTDIPNIKFVGNIFGNEPVGREMLLHFMEYLRDNYEKDNDVKCLLDNANIHLLPCLNPDGFHVAAGQWTGQCEGILGKNAEGTVGHNRNSSTIPYEISLREMNAVLKWMDEIPFVLSAGLYGGNMVAKYPIDVKVVHIPEIPNERLSLTSDNDIFRNLATVYAENHPKMRKNRCENDESTGIILGNGITNDPNWYAFQGHLLQSFNYEQGCMEIAVDISCCKYPKASELFKLWNQNKKALLKYSLEALKGVAGQVVDSVTRKPIENANLRIVDRNIRFKTTKHGQFWRILSPGYYQIEINAPGYHRIIEDFIVMKSRNTCPKATKLQISLEHVSNSKETTKHQILHRVGRSKFPNSKVEKRSTQSRIVNEPTFKWPLPPKEEEEIFKMLFGTPDEFQKTNVTEKDIRDFMENDLGINDTSKFDDILKNFDSKTEKEKIKIIFDLGQNLENVPESFTNVEILTKYIRRTLGIVDIVPYEVILKDFDKLNPRDKKKALVKILKKFQELSKNMTLSSTERTVKLSTITSRIGDEQKSSAHKVITYFSIQSMIVSILVTYVLCNYT